MPDGKCVCCSIAQQLEPTGQLHHINPHWTCNARRDHQRPALVVQSTAHRASFDDLSPQEQASLGPAIQRATNAVSNNETVQQVYVLAYNEGDPRHVHFHIVPRFAQDGPDIGPRLPDVLPPGADFDAEKAARSTAANPSEFDEPSKIVRAVLRTARLWEAKISPYRFVRDGRGLDNAEKYVTAWLCVFAVALAVAAIVGPQTPLLIGLLVIGALRAIDMGLYETKILLTVQLTMLRSVPRAIVLRAMNLIEIALAAAAIFLAHEGAPAGTAALLDGFRIIVLQPAFQQPGTIPDLVIVVGLGLSLVIILGGLAMLIGKSAETFTEARLRK